MPPPRPRGPGPRRPGPKKRRSRGTPGPRTRKGRAGAASTLDLPGAARGDRVCLGAVAGAHGVAGLVRIRSFTAEPADVAAYGALTDEAGERRFDVTVVGTARGAVLARLSGIGDRDAAEALQGMRLYVPRSALPPPEDDEFYHADLLGLEAVTAGGSPLGRVVAVHDLGGTDALEIGPDAGGGTVMVPFTRAAVPAVDLGAGRIVVDPAAGMIEDGPDEGAP